MNNASQDLPLHLGVLLAKLQHPTDYEKAFYYFIEEFGSDKRFIALGIPEEPPHLLAIAQHIAGKALGKTVGLEKTRISHVPEHRFHHGSASVDGRAVILLYFEAVNTGLLAIIPGVRGAAEFARFRLPSEPTPDLSRN